MPGVHGNTSDHVHGWHYADDAGKPGAWETCTPGLQGGIRNRANLHLAGCLPYFVGQFKLSVAERRAYRSLGAFLLAAERWINFYNQLRPHEGLDQQSPNSYASEQGWSTAPYVSLFYCSAFRVLDTCAGDWIPSQHQTNLRLVVYTSLAKV
jgi:hypothetical protein